MASAGKKSYTHVCQEKSITRGLAKNLPSPTLLLPKANGRPLSIKLQLGRFIPGNRKCNGYRWTRWTKSDRDDTDEKGERGSRGNNRGVKPHHCFVTNELILRKFFPKSFNVSITQSASASSVRLIRIDKPAFNFLNTLSTLTAHREDSLIRPWSYHKAKGHLFFSFLYHNRLNL